MPRVFINYSSKEKEEALRIHQLLTLHGFESVFLDRDRKAGMKAGEFWEHRLHHEIKRCSVLLALTSKDWYESRWCHLEFALASALGKARLTFLIGPEHREFIKEKLRDLHLGALYDGDEQLILELKKHWPDGSEGFGLPGDFDPYVGMRALTRKDRSLYFGRVADVRRIIEKLSQMRDAPCGPSRVLVLHGESGVGKSSLMRAAVLPRLQKIEADWHYLPDDIRPGSALRTELIVQFKSLIGVTLPRNEPLSVIKDWLSQRGRSVECPLLISIDQFEEVLIADRNSTESKSGIELLNQLLEQSNSIVMLTVRSSFLDATLQHFPNAEEYLVRKISMEDLSEIIRRPAQLKNIEVDDALVHAIQTDMHGDVPLPLLAQVLWQLNHDYGRDRNLTLTEYKLLKGQSESPLKAVIDNQVRIAIGRAHADTRALEALREFIVGEMVYLRPYDERSPYLRRAASLEKVPSAIRELIQQLIDRRILVEYQDCIEVAHETVFSHWTDLAQWLDADQDYLKQRRLFDEQYQIWYSAPERQKADALLGGLMLSNAENILDKHRGRFSEEQRDFVLRSVDKRERAIRELSEAQAQRAHHQRRVVQRTRVGLALASGLLVLAVVASLLAWRAQEQAVEETARAEDGLRQAAKRALGRAREALEADDGSAYAAYLAESIGYVPEVAQDEASMALQQLPSPRLNLLLTHKGTISKAAFSPDGMRVVTASHDHTAQVWDARTGKSIGLPMTHAFSVNSVAFDVGGVRIVTASADRTARIWDARTGQPLGPAMRHNSNVVSATFSPEGDRVVTASSDGTAQLWSVRTGEAIGRPMGHGAQVNSAEFSPDGLQVATTSWDGNLRLFNGKNGEEQGVMRTEWMGVSASFSSDGQLVILRGPYEVSLWDSRTYQSVTKISGFDRLVSGAVLGPANSRIVMTSGDRVRFLDSRDGTLIAEKQHKNVSSAAFSFDGRRVITVGDKSALTWSAESGNAVGSPWTADSDFNFVAISPDGRSAITAGPDGLARIWHTHASTAIGLSLRHSDRINSVEFSPDGSRVITAGDDKTTRVWDAKSGLQHIAIAHSDVVRRASVSPDSKRLITISGQFTEPNIAQLWDLKSGDLIGSPMPHASSVDHLAFSGSGNLVVTVSRGVGSATCQVWSAQIGVPIGQPMQLDSAIAAIHFSQDETQLVASGNDGEQWVWNIQANAHTGQNLVNRPETRQGNDHRALIVTPNGRHVRIPELSNLAIYMTKYPFLRGHASPDGQLVGTANGVFGIADLRVWNAIDGVQIGGVTIGGDSVVFSPDGTQIVSAVWDSRAIIWDNRTEKSFGGAIKSSMLHGITGHFVKEDGQIDRLSSVGWIAAATSMQLETGNERLNRVLRWHLTDRDTRTISPFSQITVPQHIEREIAWVLEHPEAEKPDGPNNSLKILDEAYNLDPGHPLILLALSVFETRPETKALWKRLSFPRVEKDPRLAARAAEILLIDKDPDNARSAAEIALALPTATEVDKAKARAVLTKLNTPNNNDAP